MEKIEKSIVEPQKIIVDPKKNFDNFIKYKIYMVIEHVKQNGTSRISPPKIFFGKFVRQYADIAEFSDLETNHLRGFFAYGPNKFYTTDIDINDIIKPNRGRGRRTHIRRSKKHKKTHKKRKL